MTSFEQLYVLVVHAISMCIATLQSFRKGEIGLEERNPGIFEASYRGSGQIGRRGTPDQKSGQMLAGTAKAS